MGHTDGRIALFQNAPYGGGNKNNKNVAWHLICSPVAARRGQIMFYVCSSRRKPSGCSVAEESKRVYGGLDDIAACMQTWASATAAPIATDVGIDMNR